MEEIRLIEGDDSRRKGEAHDNGGDEHGKDVAIDVYDLWLNSTKERLAASKIFKRPSEFRICRVPRDIRMMDEDAYSPSIVSIGPFHRESPNLQPMQRLKWRYIQIHTKEGNDLEKYSKEMKEDEQELRDFYSGNIDVTRWFFHHSPTSQGKGK